MSTNDPEPLSGSELVPQPLDQAIAPRPWRSRKENVEAQTGNSVDTSQELCLFP